MECGVHAQLGCFHSPFPCPVDVVQPLPFFPDSHLTSGPCATHTPELKILSPVSCTGLEPGFDMRTCESQEQSPCRCPWQCLFKPCVCVRGQRSVLGYLPLSFSTLSFETGSPLQLHWLLSQPHGLHLSPPAPQHWVSEFRYSCLHSKHFYPLSKHFTQCLASLFESSVVGWSVPETGSC